MSISELLQTTNANITVSIGLNELREFHEEIVQNALFQKETTDKEKSENKYLSTAEVCEILKVGPVTLSRWHNKGYLVPFKVGGRCRYNKSEVDSILNTKNRSKPTDK